MLINFRNAMMSGAGLPYDAELEYLEFTGTQRLLTDITPNVYARDLKTSISYQLTSTASRQLSGSSSSYFEFCSNGALVQVDASYPADLNRHTLDFIGWGTSNSSRVLYDGQNISQAGFVNSINTSNRFTFGSLRANSQSNPLKAKVYSLSMEYQDGTKLLDWVPVRVGTTGYMYDRVTRRLFGNQGTGDFVLGPDVVPVEWIESAGNQYIETGVKENEIDSYTLTTQMNTLVQYVRVLGADGAHTLFGPNTSLTTVQLSLRSYLVQMNELVDFSAKHKYTVARNLNDLIVSVDGAIQHSQPITNYDSQNNISLLSRTQATYCKLYYVRLSLGSAPVRSFRPVRVGTDATSWEGAMMDVLTRRIYRNAGSGAFGYGNDLKYPIPAE